MDVFEIEWENVLCEIAIVFNYDIKHEHLDFPNGEWLFQFTYIQFLHNYLQIRGMQG